jgi:D-serine deaminase-like pyridoxal phosphate-dependent protein
LDYQQLITRATLLLDESKCRTNIAQMCAKAASLGISLRPHFKTHQSLQIGRWFKEYGVDKITVSSLQMAEYFSSEWDDICVAFPLNIREIALVEKLAKKTKLTVLLASKEAALALAEQLTVPLDVMLKIDFGYHRSGIDFRQTGLIDDVLAQFSNNSNSRFKGFLTHSGHTYQCIGNDDIANLNRDVLAKLAELKDAYAAVKPYISYGDTPSFATQTDFAGVDELRPGNAVFYDLSQWQIGSCSTGQIAVAMACPVVGVYPERNEVVVQGGAVHLSKDVFTLDEKRVYGLPVNLTTDGWSEPLENCYVKSLSQEHGILHMSKEQLESVKIGDLVGILPVHSCLTADIHSQFLTLNGEWVDKFRTY